MNKKYIGTIVGTKGFKGSLFVSDVPRNLKEIKKNTILKIGFSETFNQEYTVRNWKQHNKGVMLDLEGINSDTEGVVLKENAIYVDAEEIKKASEGDFFEDELIGCTVMNQTDKSVIGKTIEVWYLPANDVLLVETEGGELPVPMTEEVILDINIKKKEITINMLPGLLDLLDNSGDKDE